MGWTQGADGVWTHSGTDDEAVMADAQHEATAAIVAQIADKDDAPYVALKSDHVHVNGFRVAVGGTNITVEEYDWSTLTTTHKSYAHGLSSAQPAVLEVRLINNGKVQVWLDGDHLSSGDVYDTSGSKDNLSAWGFGSAVDGAVVLKAEVCELEPNIDERRDIPVIVADGSVFCSLDGSTLFKVADAVFPTTGYVSMASFSQKCLMVGGGLARKFDPVEVEVTKWTPTAGSLPGQTDDGTTTATIVRSHRSRVVLTKADNDPQNAWFSAISDEDDWDTGANTVGRAFVLGGAGGSEAAKVGHPVTACESASGNALIIGTTEGIWRMLGDPALGTIDTSEIYKDSGVSGPEAMVLAAEGLVIAHSPDGLLVVPAAGGVRNVSKDVLTDPIQLNPSDAAARRVQILRDPARHGMHLFLSQVTGSAVTHWWYDERGVRRAAGLGGWFPDTFEKDHEPMASVRWKGKPLLACRDGYVRTFDDAQHTDDGTAIDFLASYSLLAAGDVGTDVVLNRWQMVLGLAGAGTWSDRVRVRVYAGLVPAACYDETLRWLLYSRLFSHGAPPVHDKVRAPYAIIQVTPEASGERPIVERLECEILPSAYSTRWNRKSALEPAAPCQFPDAPAGSVAGSTPPGSPDQGPGNSIPQSFGSGTPGSGLNTATTAYINEF